MNIRIADETKAVSLVLVKQNGSSEEIASKLIDFHWQIAQIIERHDEQQRQKLLEHLQKMTASERLMVGLLMNAILDHVRCPPFWPKLLDGMSDESGD